jgi:hypothetical protein
MAEEEKKQPGTPGADGTPPSETILETQERDPDEAVFAEQAIHHYAADLLDAFRDEVENAMDGVKGWLSAQTEMADDPGLLSQLGKSFLAQMMGAFSGAASPIGQAAFAKLDFVVDMAVRQEADAGLFVDALTNGARELTWSVRDELSALLTNQWPQLLDLAFEGSTAFIPALHAFGLPPYGWSGKVMEGALIAQAELAIAATPKTQEEAMQTNPDQERQQQEQLLEEGLEKQQQQLA